MTRASTRALAAILVLLGVSVAQLGCSRAATPVAEGSPAEPSAAPETPALATGGIQFVHGYNAGYSQARSSGLPLLVFFTAEWCHYCHQMADEAFTNPQVVQLSRQFICVLVDADQEPEVCKQFRVRGYPTIQFISPRGVPLNRVVGKREDHQLMMEMQAALQAVARRCERPGVPGLG